MKVYQEKLITGRIECSENTRLWNTYIKKTMVIIDKNTKKIRVEEKLVAMIWIWNKICNSQYRIPEAEGSETGETKIL